MKPLRAVLIPIDSRPVTYEFPQQVAQIAGVEVAVPPLQIMGGLDTPADCEALSVWLEDALKEFAPDLLIVCLDALAYGGLVASRCSTDPLEEIMIRVKKITEWKKLSGAKTRVFVQSSVMRIPHYNTSRTEPAYCAEFGERIFRWSSLNHQLQLGILKSDLELKELENQIPDTVLKEFLTRRERNFCVNQSLILMAASGSIDYLVFSQDDTAQYGLNVLEKTRLADQAKAIGATNVAAYAGTDETIVALLARWLIESSVRAPALSTRFIPDEGRTIVSKFEGQTIGKSFLAIAEVMRLVPEVRQAREDDDFFVVIHTAGNEQGDHLAAAQKRLDTSVVASQTIEILQKSPCPVAVCDVAYSNGADPILVESILKMPEILEKLWGYGGWNTTNNTVGSVLAMAVAVWFAKCSDFEYRRALNSALAVRFLDDWAYQSLVRPELSGIASDESLQKHMVPYTEAVAKLFDIEARDVSFKLPWKRTFEVEVGLPSSIKGANIVA